MSKEIVALDYTIIDDPSAMIIKNKANKTLLASKFIRTHFLL